MAAQNESAQNEAGSTKSSRGKTTGKAAAAKKGRTSSASKNTSKTYLAKEGEIARNWWIVDANGKNLGRMATRIATVLRGKHKPTFTPHTDVGDFVVVVNAEKVEMTGSKFTEKKYYRHSRFFGSLKSRSAEEMRSFDPAFIIEDAVKGMLPKNKMARHLLLKLKAYKGTQHPHSAQKPQTLSLD
jgi:large subunit ribosomal protein L13